MALAVLPPVTEVKALLDGLIGRDLAVTPIADWTPTPSDPFVTAEFLDDTNHDSAAAIVELTLGISLGASVGMVPPDAAQETLKSGKLDQGMTENLYEVLNVLSAVFNEGHTAHLRLGELQAPDDTTAERVGGWIERNAGKICLQVEVPDYGSGRMILVSLPAA